MWNNDESSADATLQSLARDFVRQVAPPKTPSPSSPSPDQPTAAADSSKPVIETPEQLYDYVWGTFGIAIPRVKVCAKHQSPWAAFCAGYFSSVEHSVIVIKGSRGLAGKSWLVALLGAVIGTTLRGDVTILGGSGEQALRVQSAMGKFWAAPNAPRDLVSKQTTTRTAFTAGHEIKALMASQASVRGPHPLALLIDEVDEMDQTLFDAAMGQTMDANGYPGRTIISSTHQYADGTMTAVLKLAAERGWPVFEWCWRETLEPHGWLTQAQVTRKRNELTTEMWRIEVELGEPSIEGRAINTEKVDRMFLLPEIESPPGSGAEFPYTEFELPVDGATYSTGGDWARTNDYVELLTWRDDVFPLRLVAYQRFRKKAAPYMIAAAEHQAGRYPGTASHDSTSLGGKMMDDFLNPEGLEQVAWQGVDFSGKRRANLFTNYILAIEHEELVAPRVKVLYQQHKFVTNDDLRPGGDGHPPDGFVGGALGYQGSAGAARTMDVLGGRKKPPPDVAPQQLKGVARAMAFLSAPPAILDGNGGSHGHES